MSLRSNVRQTARLQDSPLEFRLSRRLNSKQRTDLVNALAGLPSLAGGAIHISAQSRLTAHRGTLLSGRPELGIPVYAASFIRERRIVLESEVLDGAATLPLIAIHEVFHFVWPSLGNARRHEYTELLRREWEHKAKGELGESSSLKKEALWPGGIDDLSSRAGRDYVCESFCDTAAAIYSGRAESDWFTLALRWRKRRERWFQEQFLRAIH
jgi:hypothetical protein